VPDLETELSHLEAADRHVALACQQLSLIEALHLPLGESEAHRRRLGTLLQTLAEFQAHRAQIVKTIESIRDGTLPRG